MPSKIYFIFCFCFIMCRQQGIAQCNASGGLNQGAIVPSTSWQTVTMTAGEYYTFTGSPCNKYVFSFCQGGGSSAFDTQITITDVVGAPILNAFSDDQCGLQSEVYFTPFNLSTYRVYFTLSNCIPSGGTSTIAYSYSSFNVTNTNYTLILNATSAAPYNCVLLTPDSVGQIGCAWDANSTLNFGVNFSYDFTVNLGSNDAGADGICFVMHNDPRGRCAYGLYGGDIGASGILNSVIIEIDTYMNDEDRDDGLPAVPCTGWYDLDHLDLWINGVVNPSGGLCPSSPGARIIPSAIPLLDGALNYNIENGLNHLLRISWNTGTSTLTASIYNLAGITLYGTFSYVFNPLVVFGVNNPFFGFTAATGFNSNDQSFCNPSNLLPIELLSFYGKTINDKNILHWQTASEKNNDYFTLLRSKNGRDFESIGTVKGAGNSAEVVSYSLTDIKPYSNQNFYQLRQTDFDGRVSFSRIITLNSKSQVSSDLSIYPNPSASQITLDIPGDETAGYEAEISDVLGKIVIKEYNKNSFNVSALCSGIYFVKLKTNAAFYSGKFVKN